ncbi:GTP-binding protein Der [Planctomycetes bacterium CA13]|uniref:GTP-binding protein Der n=1 Tax=Novipirellula herctigrandis TaxID=2527986 RepID=A0A5C5Z1G7_9BACT|nr:GTP-binding protein Der [Planctomycetes bacterium CA13]
MTFRFNQLKELKKNPLRICVVGHTNHGKTSTIRTLVEDASFGVVDNAPGVTRNVEETRVAISGKSLFHVLDTPGFELLDERLYELREAKNSRSKEREIDGLIKKLTGNRGENDRRLLRTLEAVKSSNLVIQVLDVREEATDPQYHDEIEFLQRCGIPLIITLNFVNHKQAKVDAWQDYFQQIGIHTYTKFDAHTRRWKDEHTLFKKMESLAAETLHQDFLSSWVDYRKDFVAEATKYSATDIASLIRDVAKHRPTAYGVDRKTRSAKRAELKEQFEIDVIEMKDECIKTILKRFHFEFNDIENDTDQVDDADTITGMSLFDSSWLKWGAAAAGAAAGLAVDMMLVGGTFGIPTLIGGVAGYCLATGYEYKSDKGSCKESINASKALLFLLAGMTISLVRALKTRGRADPHRVDVRFDKKALDPKSEFASNIVALHEGMHVDFDDLVTSVRRAIDPQQEASEN